MPFKDPDKKREYAATYSKNRNANMTEEKRATRRKKNTENKNKWYNSLSNEEKRVYLDKLNAKNRARYATDADYRDRLNSRNRDEKYNTYWEKRKAVLIHLDGRCVGPECNWINEDGTRGCTDGRCLQIDHVKGNGAELRKTDPSERGERFYAKVLATVPGEEYQLLCANCNWIKRHENKEHPQARCTEDNYVFVDQRKLRKKDEQGRFVAVGAS